MFMVPQIGAGVWVEFEQGDPDYPIWVGGFWGSRPRCPLLALVPPPLPPGQSIVLQTPLQHRCHQRCVADSAMAPVPAPAPTGRAASCSKPDRRDDRGQRHRHLHPQRQGRLDRAGRADRDDQQRRAGGDLTDARLPPSRRRHGAVRARRTGAAGRAVPARAGQRAARRDAGERRTSSPAARSSPPAGNGPCVTAQWVVGAMRVLAGGAPRAASDQPGSICVPTATPLLPVVMQPRA